MRKPRHLSPDERALWDRVTARDTPLNPKRVEKQAVTPPACKEKPADRPADRPAPPFDPPQNFRVGQNANPSRANDLMPDIRTRLSRAPVAMDHKSYGKMTRGKLKPEARIDLHGMTVSQAHPALLDFILGSQAVGRRLVLVITGKGKDRDDGTVIPTRNGVLRHQVPQWLSLPPLAQAVLQVTPAHLKHGGHGAYYVYLRRSR